MFLSSCRAGLGILLSRCWWSKKNSIVTIYEDNAWDDDDLKGVSTTLAKVLPIMTAQNVKDICQRCTLEEERAFGKLLSFAYVFARVWSVGWIILHGFEQEGIDRNYCGVKGRAAPCRKCFRAWVWFIVSYLSLFFIYECLLSLYVLFFVVAALDSLR